MEGRGRSPNVFIVFECLEILTAHHVDVLEVAGAIRTDVKKNHVKHSVFVLFCLISNFLFWAMVVKKHTQFEIKSDTLWRVFCAHLYKGNLRIL